MYDLWVIPLRSCLSLAILVCGCAKIIGIEDYKLRDASATEDGPAATMDAPSDAPFGSALGYIKASNTGGGDSFASSIALSADGSTLVVGAPFEDSASVGIDQDGTNNLAGDAGAVYVFVRSGTSWMQQAYLKASNTGGNDRFGTAVAISADGSAIAVGAIGEDSSSFGIDGVQTNNNSGDSGAVYLFARAGTTWAQQAYIKASNTDGDDQFGRSVALSQDANTLAVGAILEDSAATTINGSQADADPQTQGTNFGAVYVFVRAGALWVQQAYMKASNAENDDQFGAALALSSEGDTLAVGANREDSSATNTNGDQSNNSAGNAGAAYVFRRVSGIWAQQVYVKATNTNGDDQFGTAVALAADGNTLAVGAPFEDGSASGIDGVNNNNAGNAGAVYIYAQIAATWTVQAYVKASNTGSNDQFGIALALVEDGNTLIVGAHTEDSAGDGLVASESDNLATDAGAAYAFTRVGSTWQQSQYLKATNSEAGDRYGIAVAVADGPVFVIGASLEDSGATGIGGDQTSNLATSAGAAYVVQ